MKRNKSRENKWQMFFGSINIYCNILKKFMKRLFKQYIEPICANV